MHEQLVRVISRPKIFVLLTLMWTFETFLWHFTILGIAEAEGDKYANGITFGLAEVIGM